MSKREVLSEYDKVIEALFLKKFDEAHNPDVIELDFFKDELTDIAKTMNIVIRNFPDVTYTYRTRGEMPESILQKGNWIIKQKGKSNYAFIKTRRPAFIQIPEAAIRYNRLVDIFTEITCFHLQSHIRTTIEGEGQIEIDDMYVGIDHDGKEYILPLEAKSPDPRDKLGWIQVTNLVKFSHQYFPRLKCRPICAKPIDRNTVYLIEFEDKTDYDDIGIREIRLYHLVRTQ
ncbi:MAG: hypothetical protein NT112_01540 [Methanoregula sp.]|nr:hypothetical protein [Methanoregula sp.]